MERFGVRALLVSADLMEIFQGVGLMHLVVLEGDRPGRAAVVRGLVARSSLERRLHEPD
jgi:hypothetical protein